MKMIVRLFIAGLIVVSTFALNSMAFAAANALFPEKSSESVVQTTDIEVFVRNGCPHCAKAELFLQSLKQEQPALRIVIHDVSQEPAALEQLQQLAKNQGVRAIKVPAFHIGEQLIVGFSDEITTGQLIRGALTQAQLSQNHDTPGSCEAEQSLSCEAEVSSKAPQPFMLDFFGHKLSLDEVGLPLFTLAMACWTDSILAPCGIDPHDLAACANE